MGVCALNDEQARKKRESNNNDNLQNHELEINKDVSKIENKSTYHIINRLSKRTKFENINNDYIITDNILGKGATGIVREGQDKNGEKYAIKTVWKSDIEKNEFFKKEIDISLEVNHESIIKCLEVYEDNSALHFV